MVIHFWLVVDFWFQYCFWYFMKFEEIVFREDFNTDVLGWKGILYEYGIREKLYQFLSITISYVLKLLSTNVIGQVLIWRTNIYTILPIDFIIVIQICSNIIVIIRYSNLYRNTKIPHSRWLSFISFLYANNCHSIMGGRNRFLYFCIPVILSYSLSFHYSYPKQRLETIFFLLQSILSSRWTQNNVTMKYNILLFPKSVLIIFFVKHIKQMSIKKNIKYVHISILDYLFITSCI